MCRLLRLALLANAVVLSCDAFTWCINPASSNGKRCYPTRSKLKATSNDNFGITKQITSTYEAKQQQLHKLPWLQRRFRKKADAQKENSYRFTYDTNELVIGDTSKSVTTAVMLIHPIGVGIGKWYYDRLLASIEKKYGDIEHRLVFLAPDLLGSATASGPIDEKGDLVRKLPLLNITDWSGQITHLMAEYEAKSGAEGHAIGSWSVVANGGCAPIALKIASTSSQKSAPFKASLTNVIISSPPRLPFFLDSTDPTKVHKSYRTLSGITGKLFWWYSLRKGGRFIQRFSEKNLVGDAENLGEEWTPNCLEAARLHDGQSRYSTFAFLAGALQDGCSESLNALKGSSNVTIDFIRGDDKRRNRAKSWFWTRKKKENGSDSSTKEGVDDNNDTSTEETIQQYVSKNGNRGNELFVGGRISLAWEDSSGYAKRLMELLCE